MGTLRQFSDELETLAARAAPAVASIRHGRGSGCATVVAPDGYLLTNAHVVEGQKTVAVRCADGWRGTGTIIGRDPATDLAVLRVEAGDLKPLALRERNDARIGELVVAIGNPLQCVAFLPFTGVRLKTAKLRPPTIEPKTLGEHIRRRRIEAGLLQREVAEQLQVRVTAIVAWENGRQIPEDHRIPVIIRFLGYDPLPPADSWGERIRHRRQQLGLSRKALSQVVGIHEMTLLEYEHGKRQPKPKNRAILDRFVTGDA